LGHRRSNANRREHSAGINGLAVVSSIADASTTNIQHPFRGSTPRPARPSSSNIRDASHPVRKRRACNFRAHIGRNSDIR
jgi:hypothetical protein